MKQQHVVLALSGGLDSTTLLSYFITNTHCKVTPVVFNYHSKHSQWEIAAAEAIARHYGLVPTRVDLSFINQLFKSNLLHTGGDIPEGRYQDSSMALTVVPGRNTIFIAIMMGLAQSIGANTIALGVHGGDHFIYPDCRPQYIDHMYEVVRDATEGQVVLTAPFLHNSKSEIVSMGLQMGAPYHLTRTCYKDQPLACGKCGSCVERLEAFKLAQAKDPVDYEERDK